MTNYCVIGYLDHELEGLCRVLSTAEEQDIYLTVNQISPVHLYYHTSQLLIKLSKKLDSTVHVNILSVQSSFGLNENVSPT